MGALSFILLLLGLASFTNSETCPKSSLLQPACACEEDKSTGIILVDCASEGKYSMANLNNAIKSLKGKQKVDMEISDFSIDQLPADYFHGIHLTKLELDNCKINYLSHSTDFPPFHFLENDLEELSIISSFKEENIRNPQKIALIKLGHLRKLRELELSFNSFTELRNDWFSGGPASLEYILISDNGFQNVGDRAFANLINLKQLSFNGNRFGSIKRSMLPNPAAGLEKLELNNNGFTSIPEDLFSNMPVLRGIALRENGLLRLDQRTWQPVWQSVKYITLEENPIECGDHMNWIFKIKETPAIYGKCNAPSDLKAWTLSDFIDSRKAV